MTEFFLLVFASVVGGVIVFAALKHRADKRAANLKAWQRAMDEESRELDRLMAETEANAARHQAHLAQQKAYVPLVLPPKPSPEEQAKRDAAYQEAVASRYRGVPVRQVDLSRPGRGITPTTRTYEPTPDISFTDSGLTAIAISNIFDSDSSSSSSPSPDPTPSWDSSDSSSGSGFGGGGSSDSW